MTWRGRILGPLVGPSFVGHMHAASPAYDQLTMDALDGDIDYSPDGFRLAHAAMTRGQTAVALALFLRFDGDWNFLDASPWTMDARIENARPADDVESVMSVNYPLPVASMGRFTPPARVPPQSWMRMSRSTI